MATKISQRNAAALGLAGKKHHKYRAVPTVVDGIRFSSKAESRRYGELKLLQRAGKITGLQLQPRFTLLTKQNGQRAIVYVADFSYREYNGEEWLPIIEDFKGVETAVFKIKAKMFRVKYPEYELRITKTKRR